MAPTGTCAAPIKGTHLRLVKTDICGIPVTGASSLVIVTKGFVQTQMDPDYEDGEEFFERNADGQVCVNQKDKPTLKRFKLTVDLCDVSPDAMTALLDARLIANSGATTGTGFAVQAGEPDNYFSMEVWQRVAGAGACDPSGNQQFIYNAWPWIGNIQVGKYSIENKRSTMQFMAETQGANPLWGRGPGTGPKWLPTTFAAVSIDHWIWNITSTALPTNFDCGPQLLT
jgi:hypothetical protein